MGEYGAKHISMATPTCINCTWCKCLRCGFYLVHICFQAEGQQRPVLQKTCSEIMSQMSLNSTASPSQSVSQSAQSCGCPNPYQPHPDASSAATAATAASQQHCSSSLGLFCRNEGNSTALQQPDSPWKSSCSPLILFLSGWGREGVGWGGTMLNASSKTIETWSEECVKRSKRRPKTYFPIYIDIFLYIVLYISQCAASFFLIFRVSYGEQSYSIWSHPSALFWSSA